MNVFVLCTGRCGSHAFYHACRHSRRFSAGHESRTSFLGPDRLAYPFDHIEIDNRLAWLLGRLDDAYGDRARYVHLTRDRGQVALSLSKRSRMGIMAAYAGQGILMGLSRQADPYAVAMDYCETVTRNIAAFLRDKSHVMEISIEAIEQAFPKFCDWIGADIDLAAALAEFSAGHAATT